MIITRAVQDGCRRAGQRQEGEDRLGDDHAGHDESQHGHQKGKSDRLGDSPARLAPALRNRAVPSAIEDTVSNQQQEQNRADDLMGRIAEPVIGESGHQQTGRQEVKEQAEQEQGSHGM